MYIILYYDNKKEEKGSLLRLKWFHNFLAFDFYIWN